MNLLPRVFSGLGLAMFAQVGWSSDACSDAAIYTAADVSVSDGSAFRTESYFRSRDEAAIRHIDSDQQVVAVEGPLSWMQRGDKSRLGGAFEKNFALGHQYHALLLHFDDIVENTYDTENIEFGGRLHSAKTGENPYGGTLHLIDGDDRNRPAGMLFEIPDSPPIETQFSDWRTNGEYVLPHHIRVDDGQLTFDYRYTTVDRSPQALTWFADSVGTPDLEEARIYRLHRALLAAHCLGNADLIADLSDTRIISANSGDLDLVPQSDIREQFASVLGRLNYTEYHDVVHPIMQVSGSADMAWIAANVRSVGNDEQTGKRFDDQWAWLMILKKIDGKWVHAGNASNIKL